MRYCADNALFAQAAASCLRRAETEAQVASQRLAKIMAVQESNKLGRAARQTGTMEVNQDDLLVASGALSSLIERTSAARAEVGAYIGHLLWPEPVSPQILKAHLLNRWLAQFPCVEENRRFLRKARSALDKKVRELEAAKAGADRLHARSSGRETGLQSAGGPILKASPAARTPASIPATRRGRSAKDESTITGRVVDDKIR